jgi:hypothetical protein
MIARLIDKKSTQDMIKVLRDAGLEVEKRNGMYVCEHEKAGLLFKAAPGNNGYLVRMRSDLFD